MNGFQTFKPFNTRCIFSPILIDAGCHLPTLELGFNQFRLDHIRLVLMTFLTTMGLSHVTFSQHATLPFPFQDFQACYQARMSWVDTEFSDNSDHL